MPIEQATRIIRKLEVVVTVMAVFCLLMAWAVGLPALAIVVFGAACAYGGWTFTRPIAP
jgi:flagellar biosynthesis component FlhA